LPAIWDAPLFLTTHGNFNLNWLISGQDSNCVVTEFGRAIFCNTR